MSLFKAKYTPEESSKISIFGNRVIVAPQRKNEEGEIIPAKVDFQIKTKNFRMKPVIIKSRKDWRELKRILIKILKTSDEISEVEEEDDDE